MLGIPYTLHEIAQLIRPLDLFQGTTETSRLRYIAYDSRLISHGSQTVFVAIKTENRDGHDFIQDAIDKGVRNFIVERKLPFRGLNYILVDDSLNALQLWAMEHRMRFPYPVIGITGSNGKTTVKEWLATLLEMHCQIVKSPMSYNSQLGVPLSVLQMKPGADVAIIEAGISQPNEMAVLAGIIQPTIGMLTHMGEAHGENFDSDREKLEEKCELFEGVDVVLMGTDQEDVWAYVKKREGSCKGVGKSEEAKLRLTDLVQENGRSRFSLEDGLKTHNFSIPFTNPSDIENVLLALLAVHELEIPLEEVADRLNLLYPVQMRTEIISDNPDLSLINDSYNSDPDSIRNAFQLLETTQSHPQKKLIISDVEHVGKDQMKMQKELLKEAELRFGAENIWTIGQSFQWIRHKQSYATTDDFLKAMRYTDFQNSVVLLKGARKHELERIIPFLNQKLNSTYFKINLDALSHNLRSLKSLLSPQTKIMCMVKAFSYGSGSWEIARTLEREGVEYLAVAYSSEGVELRKAGINLPIIVMNADEASIPALLQYELEPQIYQLPFLQKFLRLARLSDLQEYRIHLKFDTGMGRLGFREKDISEIVEFLSHYPDVQVVSVLSHLAAADDPKADAFTEQQAQQFLSLYQQLTQSIGIAPLRHLLNSAGVIRFPHYAMDMVRLGIALYGINPTDNSSILLEEIGGLYSTISQIHEYPENTSIGYGRAQFTERRSRIATVPIGYADGFFRSLGNGKISLWVRGQAAPIFGRICMDMLMIDVTDIPQAQEGDEVMIFGKQGGIRQSVEVLAQATSTISYEILSRISPRVRRVYVAE